ncbi:MAG: glycosyltransferase family 2 protein [Pseudomonadota bacterium]
MTTPLRPPISAYFRTQNEASNLPSALEGAFQIADEVLVVDSGSTDDTIAIAESAGARVIRQEWLGNGKQKRIAEDAARHDWLLDLDADEVVTPELATEISALFANGPPDKSIFRTPMAYAPPIGAPWVGFGGVKRHKLYDRRVVRQPDHKAWDQFAPPSGVQVGRLANPILHYAWRDAEGLVAKVNRNSTTRARLLPLKPRGILSLRILFGLPIYISKRFLFDGLFRAGVDGFAFSAISGYGRWLRDVKMYERLRMEEAKGARDEWAA